MIKQTIALLLVVALLTLPVSALRTESEYSAEAFEAALYGELRPLASDFLKAEEAYGVSALYLASIAALESGWGKECFRQNNIFGFGQLAFSSKAECIDYVARYLSENYLSPGGMYYNGMSIEGINVRWNGRPEWAEAVEAIKEQIESRCKEFVNQRTGEVPAEGLSQP